MIGIVQHVVSKGGAGAILALLILSTPFALSSRASAQGDPQALIDQARAAADADENERARDLFAQTLTLAPGRREEILQEYADQLYFTDRTSEAILLYREALASAATPEEAERLESALARALLSAGRHDEAVGLWQQRLEDDPNDLEVQNELQEALLALARSHAAASEHEAAAAVFERIFAINPSARRSLLREYADQLTYAQQAARAIPLYDEAIADAALPEAERELARRNRAFALLWSSSSEAEAAWAELAAENPEDAEAASNLEIARATAPSADPATDAAEPVPAPAQPPAPASHAATLLSRAEELTFSDRAAEAIPLYRRALETPLSSGERRDALLGLARAQSWSGDAVAAGSTYDLLLATDPTDREALRGRATILTWTGRAAEGQRIFDRLLTTDPTDDVARRGGAEARMYQGRQREALRLLRPLLEQDDAEAQSLAARAELWRGRPDRAAPLATAALAARPDDAGAAEAARDAARQLRPETELGLSLSQQDNGLRIFTQDLRHRFDRNGGRSSVALVEQLMILHDDAGEVRVLSQGVAGSHAIDDVSSLEGSISAAWINSATDTRVRPLFDVTLRRQATDDLRLDFFTNNTFFDDRISIANGITMTSLGLSADYRTVYDWRLRFRGGIGFVNDGNQRVFAEGEVERQVQDWPVFMGLRNSYQSFSRPSLDNGYFNPDWINTASVIARFEHDFDNGWTFGGDGSGGYEWKEDGSQGVWSAGLWARYEANDRVAFTAGLRHQDSAAIAGADTFWRTTGTLMLSLRW